MELVANVLQFSFPPDLEDLREHANSVAKKVQLNLGALMIRGSMAIQRNFQGSS